MPPNGEMRAWLKEKVEEADLALALKVEDGKTPQWAAANVEFADALLALAAEEDDRTAFNSYRQAITAYEEALQIYSPTEHPDDWSRTNIALAKTLRLYALRDGGDVGRLHLQRARQLVGAVISKTAADCHADDHALSYIEMAHINRAYADTDRSGKRRSYLEEAVVAFAKAAEIFRNKEQFDNWAVTLVGQAMAWRESADTTGKEALPALYHAIDLFKTALSYYTCASHPLDWLYVHYEYGRTFLRMAHILCGERRFDAASAAVDALRIATRSASIQSTPDLWLRLHMELAVALSCLAQYAQSGASQALLEEVAQIYTSAAGYYEEKNRPVDLALVQGQLGKSLLALGAARQGEESQACRLKAIDALRKAVSPVLKEERRQDWIAHFIELGTAFHLTANHDQTEKRFSLYEEALTIYREALLLIARDEEPDLCARLQNWMGLALAYLGEHDESDTGLRRLKESELAFRLALACCEDKRQTAEYTRLESNLANLFYTMARRSDDTAAAHYLQDARHILLRAMRSLDARQSPAEWKTAQWNYGLVVKHALERNLTDQPDKDYDEATAAFREALACLPVADDPQENLSIKRALASLLLMRARNSAKMADGACLEEAITLLTEIHDWAVQNGEASIIRQAAAEKSEALTFAETRRRHGVLSKLHHFFKAYKKSKTPR